MTNNMMSRLSDSEGTDDSDYSSEYGYSSDSFSGGVIHNSLTGSENYTDENIDYAFKPTGGFPPIYVCKKGKTKKDIMDNQVDKKKREYSTSKTTVSIKDILEKRRQVKAFI